MMTRLKELEIKKIELLLEKDDLSISQENSLRQYLKCLKEDIEDKNGKSKL